MDEKFKERLELTFTFLSKLNDFHEWLSGLSDLNSPLYNTLNLDVLRRIDKLIKEYPYFKIWISIITQFREKFYKKTCKRIEFALEKGDSHYLIQEVLSLMQEIIKFIKVCENCHPTILNDLNFSKSQLYSLIDVVSEKERAFIHDILKFVIITIRRNGIPIYTLDLTQTKRIDSQIIGGILFFLSNFLKELKFTNQTTLTSIKYENYEIVIKATKYLTGYFFLSTIPPDKFSQIAQDCLNSIEAKFDCEIKEFNGNITPFQDEIEELLLNSFGNQLITNNSYISTS